MKVYIMSGISGSGKTTYVNAHKRPDDYVFSADDYFTHTDGSYAFDGSKLARAHNNCMREYVDHVVNYDRNHNVWVDNTNTTVEEIAPYYAVAEAYDCNVEIVIVNCDIDVSYRRNTHNVPLSAIRSQHIRLTECVFPRRWNRNVVIAGI